MTIAELTLRTTAESKVVAVVERLQLGRSAGADPAAGAPQPPNRHPRRTQEQSAVLPAVAEQVRGRRGEDGFRGAAILASRYHNRLTVYRLFDAGVRNTGLPSPRVLPTIEALGVPVQTLDWRTSDMVWRDGNEAPTVVSLRHTPVVHFGLFTVLDDRADALLATIQAGAPASLTTPGGPPSSSSTSCPTSPASRPARSTGPGSRPSRTITSTSSTWCRKTPGRVRSRAALDAGEDAGPTVGWRPAPAAPVSPWGECGGRSRLPRALCARHSGGAEVRLGQ